MRTEGEVRELSRFLGLVLTILVFAAAVGAVIVAERKASGKRVALRSAAELGDLERVRLLVTQGADMNARTRRVMFGWTPLLAAIYHERTNVALYLIQSGANVNMADDMGETPLMRAVEQGETLVVKELLSRGADLYAKDRSGIDAFGYANTPPPKPEIVDMLESAKAKQKLK